MRKSLRGVSEKMEIQNRTAIFLIGFMAAGKSTIGKHLAEPLDCSYQDTDAEVEKRGGMPIHDILEKKGKSYFRYYVKKLGISILSLAGKYPVVNNLVRCCGWEKKLD